MLRRICNLLGFSHGDFEANKDGNYVFAQGNTVPTDATAGYAVGCIFIHRDGSAGSAVYYNEGTESSCDFNASGSVDADNTFTGANTFTDVIKPKSASGIADAANAVLMGSGTTASPNTSAVADDKFLEFRCQSTATSGDNRLAYLRYALDGDAGGGECLRAFTDVGANVGTAHGAHLSLAFDATAGGSECSGLGAACRGTLHIPDIASWAPTGTYASGYFEIYSDGTASDPAGMTELSVLYLANSGNATGKADVDTDANVISIQGFTAAADTSKAISSVSLAELPSSSVGIRCKIGATTYYIPAVAATEWN